MKTTQIPDKIQKLIKEKQGLKIDVGSGASKQPGFFGIDILPFDTVDLVWDIEKTPWPLPDECALQVIASHVLEHINPHSGDKRLQGLVDLLIMKGTITKDEADEYMGLPGPGFINVMNEIWRILKPNCKFAFVVPYAESPGMMQDPTHTNFVNEATMDYFDPLQPSGLYQFYRPKPWKIEAQYVQINGLLEVVLVKRPEDESYKGISKPTDITREEQYVEEVRTK
jgi:SAM-dependent methyltransferase